MMERAVSDVLLYFRFKHGKIVGVTGDNKDENMEGGSKGSQCESGMTLKKFEFKPRS